MKRAVHAWWWYLIHLFLPSRRRQNIEQISAKNWKNFFRSGNFNLRLQRAEINVKINGTRHIQRNSVSRSDEMRFPSGHLENKPNLQNGENKAWNKWRVWRSNIAIRIFLLNWYKRECSDSILRNIFMSRKICSRRASNFLYLFSI